MTPQDDTPEYREQQVNQILAAYLDAERTGQATTPEELLAQYPDLASELRSFFIDKEVFEREAELLGLATAPVPSQDVPRAPKDTASPEAPTIAQESRPAPASGESIRFFGDYELLEEIARGGMGVVYKARQVSLNRIVAVKMILAGQLASEAEVKRFCAEAEAAANLQHPNIVAIHEVGKHEGQHYFSMDFIEGISLAELVREKPLPGQRAAKYVKIIADAIDYAHQQGTLHRDLKPSNVLIDANDQPRVTDFGLAKRIEGGSEQTATGQVIGTPSYMPPEQAGARRGALGPASDVYSVGAILYELLTGRPPFRAETPVDTLLQVLEAEPVSPRLLNSRVERDLETICLKCLQKVPARRYASAHELSEDLLRYQAGEPIKARPVGRLERLGRWAKRNPALATVSSLAVVALLAGTAIAIIFAFYKAQSAAQLRAKHNDLRRTLYGAQMTQVPRFLERGDIQGACDLLDRYRPAPGEEDLRGFEWFCLWHRSHPERRILAGHEIAGDVKTRIELIKLAPKGHILLIVSQGRCKLVDINSAQETATFPATGPIAFSNDGKMVAIANREGPIVLREIPTGRELIRLEKHTGPIGSLAFSPDGKTVAAGCCDLTVKLWEVGTGRQRAILRGHQGAVNHVVFSPDGAFLACGTTGGSKLWDMRVLKERTAYYQEIGSRNWAYTAPVFASATLAVITRNVSVSSLCLWDVANDRIKGAIPNIDPNASVLFSPDGKTILTIVAGGSGAGDGLRGAYRCQFYDAKIWDAATLQERSRVRIVAGEARSPNAVPVVFTPDGRSLITARDPFGDWTAVQVDVATGRAQTFFKGHKLPIWSLSITSDGKTLVTAGDDHTFRLWDVEASDGATCQGHKGAVYSMAFSPDGKKLASASLDKTVKLWDVSTGREIGNLTGHRCWVLSVAISPDGNILASGGGNHVVFPREDFNRGEIKLWDLATGRERSSFPQSAAVTNLSISPGGNTLAALLQEMSSGKGRQDHLVVWDLKSAARRCQIDLEHGNGGSGPLLFAPNGETLFLACDYLYDPNKKPAIQGWDLRTGAKSLSFPYTPPVDSGPFRWIGVSPNGKVAVIGTLKKRQLWDLVKQQELVTLQGPPPARDMTLEDPLPLKEPLAFSADGKTLATGDGRTVVLWQTATGTEVGRLADLAAPVCSITFSPDGRTLAAAGVDGTIRLWKTEK
jgi:WD40 repeat protein/tRNA A-37 threonylcarbamoyl transferase component Bud32